MDGLTRPRHDGSLRSSASAVALAVGVVALVAVVARLAIIMPEAAVVIAVAVLAIGITAVQPGLIPLTALPLLLVVLRVGSGGVDLSLSDFALAAATLPALFLARRPFAPGLRALLWASAAYQFATLVTVVNNPYAANVVEWAHAWMSVSGGLLVGWAVGANGFARRGVRLIVGTIAIIAVITVVQGAIQFAGGDFAPVYVSFPFPMHKNFVGTVCAIGAAMVYARPRWVGYSRAKVWALLALMFLAVLLTQSRQAVVGIVAAVFVLVLRQRSDRRRSKLVVLALAPMLVLVSSLVQDQLQSDNRFNSVLQRLSWFEDSLDVWATDPWFGVGLRWWYTDRFPVQFQPPNAEVEVLTSAGVVGLVAFLFLMAMSLRVAWRLDPVYGSLAVAVLVNRFVQAQFDLFWAAVQSSIPFVVLGICIGAHRWAQQHPEEDPGTRGGAAAGEARPHRGEPGLAHWAQRSGAGRA